MPEKPILLNGDMVRATITCAKCGHISVPFPCEKCGSVDFVKTNTRRPMRGQPEGPWAKKPLWVDSEGYFHSGESESFLATKSCLKSPYTIGDVLYVRETFCPGCDKRGRPCYRANFSDRTGFDCDFTNKWKPSVHMPKKVARIFLKVKSVRVERVQDISEGDAKAEGVLPENAQLYGIGGAYQNGFWELWDSIYAKRGYGWDANPYVFTYEFKRVIINA